MQWLNFLTLMICPLMMLLCMKGHGDHSHGNKKTRHDHADEMMRLSQENKHLKHELQQLKLAVKKKHA